MQKYAIIPKPVELHPYDGFFEITAETIMVTDEPDRGNAAYLRDFLAPAVGAAISIRGDSGQAEAIQLKINPGLENLGEAGYTLTVDPAAISIQALTPTGIFYGIQSLRQLLPIQVENQAILRPEAEESSRAYPSLEASTSFWPDQWLVPCCEISDYPRFAWRGYMLDEGRHFHGKGTVLQTLDLMALQKLNILHWHLTEDQGWRIEIKRYPQLTEIGSQRAGTSRSFNDMRKNRHDGLPHGGFYTQDEIRQIVAYAAERQITIIPEIEIPGHSLAALAAYPELSCTGGEFQVGTRFGIFKDVYCPGKETTFEFLQNVLDEVMELFPSKIIHIGGDEAPKARWKECPDCQRRITEEGLTDVHDLQVYTTNRIGAYLAAKDRRLIGWNEILGSNLSEDAIVQYWVRNKKGLLQAVRDGQKVVNSAYLDTYLDHSYALTPLSRAYHFEPIFKELDAEAAQNILGLEAPLWTEWVPNRARLDYQTYPRLTAFAEVGWTPAAQRTYADFRERLTAFNQRLDILGARYAPEEDWEPPWYRRLFGTFTIAQAQTKIR